MTNTNNSNQQTVAVAAIPTETTATTTAITTIDLFIYTKLLQTINDWFRKFWLLESSDAIWNTVDGENKSLEKESLEFQLAHEKSEGERRRHEKTRLLKNFFYLLFKPEFICT